MPAVAASLSARVQVAAPLRGSRTVRHASAKPVAVTARLDSQRLAAAAAAVLLLNTSPAFATSDIISGSDSNADAKALALKLQAELAAKTSSKVAKNFGKDAPKAPRPEFKVRDSKEALASKPDFTISLPSFGNPFAGLGSGGTPAAAAPKAAESSSSGEEGASLLPVLLLLFSPLAIVQALSLQTVVRLGTQAVTGSQAAGKK